MLFCEVSATKVRTKTIAVATAAQAIVGIVMTVAIPYMINQDQANWRGKIGFFFGERKSSPHVLTFLGLDAKYERIGGLSVLCLIWAYFRIPETKGRTYEELDLMFERKVKTRAFKNYKIT